jgi:hypothetical protein
MILMICLKTHTQLPLEGLVEKSEESQDLHPKLPPAEETLSERASRKQREYRKLNYEKIRATEIRSDNRRHDKKLARIKEPEVRKRLTEYRRRWRKNNPDKWKEEIKWGIAHSRERRQRDPVFAFKFRIRSRLYVALKGNGIKKHKKTEYFLGCTVLEAKAHIERQFVNGMSFEDRKSFHVDHVVPVAAFDLADPEEQRWAFNYQNLRPLTPKENMAKHDKLPSPLPSWLPEHIAARIIARSPRPLQPIDLPV